MKTVLFILLLISASKAIYLKKCSNSSDTTVTFNPSEDHIVGRYKVEFCTKADKNVIQWRLVLRYISTKCEYVLSTPKLPSHSNFLLSVENDLNCTQVCFSTLLDLVFTNSCYHIKTNLIFKNNSASKINDSYHYITNNITKEDFTHIPVAYAVPYEGQVIVRWELGYVPALNFYVTIKDNETNEGFNTTCDVSGKFESEVSCNSSLPTGRCYNAELRHYAYWTTAFSLFDSITNIRKEFCVPKPYTPVASSSPMGEWPTVVGIVPLVLLAVAVCCVVRRRYVAARQRRVRENWLKITTKEPIKSPNVYGNILLLYARDCASFKCAAERLGVLVHRATGCQVIDVYSGSSMRLWASGGDEWLRLMLERDDTRVLLLQSPAGALLTAELAETRAGPALAAPLLGSLMSWRRPHAGDALLALALRQLAAAPPSAPYKKHYVANISGLGADMAPSVTSLRRYTLPATVTSLLRDLEPNLNMATNLDLEPPLDKASNLILAPDLQLQRSELEPLMQQFKEAADAYTDHVRDHPDYLAEELLFKS